MANVPVYCLCGQPYDATRFMIHCDVCKDWFHGSCVNLREHQSNDIENFHCPKCTKIFGPSKYKLRTNWHRHDHTEQNADNKAVQTGTPVFVEELKSRHFPSADEIILRLHGHQLTISHLLQEGFTVPILVEAKDGLGLTAPHSELSVQEIVNLIGPNREVDVIDVGKQDNIRMTLQQFVDYMYDPNRTRILNLISLEFSNTRLSHLVEAPTIVRRMSWVNTVWPKQPPEDTLYTKPEVEKYCLMGVADCYTDFHVDFGGTSVWYHVLAGEKVFYLIRPTLANLTLYEQWMSSSNQSETFFGDQVDNCYQCIVKQGQTLLIPTGWIHAVFTPVQSLVFGGNFLHEFNIALQLQIYELERRIKTPEKYRFPHFELMNWYAAKYIREELKTYNENGEKPAQHLMQGIKALIAALKMWTQNKDLLKLHKPEIPETIQHAKLIKDLNKEFRHAEKQFPNQANDKKKKSKIISPDFGKQSNSSPKKRLDAASSDPSHQWSLKLTLPKNSFHCDKTLSPLKDATTPKMLPESPFKLWLNKTTTHEGKRGSADLKVKLPKANGKAKKNVNKSSARKGNKMPNVKKELVSSQKKDDSVYDFRDSDEDGLVVDENPKNFLSNANKSKVKDAEKQGTLKLHLSFNGKSAAKQDPDLDADGIDVTSFTKNSGIEELLRASGYTENETKIEEEFGNGRASPSTREAIQGMLSIGCAVQFSTLTSSNSRFGSSGNSSNHQRSQRQRKFILSDDVGENMSKCHQDDEYVYPTLDASDDEIHVFKPRGRVKKDEPWNPKAKLTPNCPKPQRPVREGVRKEAVESGLAAAAAKLANLPPPKRPYCRRKSVQPKPSLEEEPEPTTSSALKRSASLDSSNKGKKPRKGMATAKQRLGKILKIHKMLH